MNPTTKHPEANLVTITTLLGRMNGYDPTCLTAWRIICTATMSNLHDDVTYKGWGKSSAAGHRECTGNSKCVLRRSVSLLRGKTDRLHVLIFATQRVGVHVFMSESDGCIAVR